MRNFQDIFPGLSSTLNFNFQDFPGPKCLVLEFSRKKIQDFPGGVGTLHLATWVVQSESIPTQLKQIRPRTKTTHTESLTHRQVSSNPTPGCWAIPSLAQPPTIASLCVRSWSRYWCRYSNLHDSRKPTPSVTMGDFIFWPSPWPSLLAETKH